jgi:triosephosphate isomerase
VIGNWKQQHGLAAAEAWTREVVAGLGARARLDDRCLVGVAPGHLALARVAEGARGTALRVFGQDLGVAPDGPHTGEIGGGQLRDAGAAGVLVGHSERRALHQALGETGETDATVRAKLQAALEAGLEAVLCVGEPLRVRERGEHESFVIAQLSSALAGFPPELPTASLTIAYEPIWAIGTGRVAAAEDVAAMHATIRAALSPLLGPAAAAGRSVLYGGSVKPGNATALLSLPGVDGLLVGGASLSAPDFLAIVDHALALASPGSPRPLAP